MNKNLIAVFAVTCGLFIASCDTPKDLRPGEKVSTDYVEPGTRGTFNVSDAGNMDGEVSGTHDDLKTDQVMPGHDLGGNTIQPGDSVSEKVETNTEAGATRH